MSEQQSPQEPQGPQQNEDPKSFWERLERTRDELKLQNHLFNAEVKDKWEEMEKKWEKFNQETNPAQKATHDAAKKLGEAQRLWLSEIAKGYKEIKNSLKQ